MRPPRTRVDRPARGGAALAAIACLALPLLATGPACTSWLGGDGEAEAADEGPGVTLEARPLASGASYPGASRGGHEIWLLGSRTAFEATFRKLVAGRLPAPELPAVDFERELVLGVTLGQKATGGYGLALSGVERRGDEIVATLASSEPAPGGMTIQMITSPYLLVALPTDDDVERVVVVLDGQRIPVPVD